MEKKYIVRLSDAEREQLQFVISKLNGSGQKVRRAQILLKADADGPAWTDSRIAEAFGCRVNANWSLRLLAEKVVELGICSQVSHETIRQTLKKIA